MSISSALERIGCRLPSLNNHCCLVLRGQHGYGLQQHLFPFPVQVFQATYSSVFELAVPSLSMFVFSSHYHFAFSSLVMQEKPVFFNSDHSVSIDVCDVKDGRCEANKVSFLCTLNLSSSFSILLNLSVLVNKYF